MLHKHPLTILQMYFSESEKAKHFHYLVRRKKRRSQMHKQMVSHDKTKWLDAPREI